MGIPAPNPELSEKMRLGREDPIFFAHEMLGMELHDGQKKFLREALKAIYPDKDGKRTRRFVLSCANRWGKSAVIAVLQLWYLFYKFGVNARTQEEWFDIEYRTANIAPFSSLTEPVFKAMKQIMTSAYPIRDRNGEMTTNKCQIPWFFLEERTINQPPYKLYFAFNSYIEHLSLMGNKGDSLQGKPYGLITYDEASRSDHLELEINDAIIGRLLDWTAPLHLLSTPAQDSASLLYYYDLYKEGLVGLNDSYTQTGSIFENTFFTPKQLEEQEKLIGNSPLKNQILHGDFIFGTETLFPGQDILDAEDEDLNDGVRYEDGHKYVVGIDTAIGSDEMVYVVIDVTDKPYRMVWMEAAKGASRSPQLHMNVLCNLIDAYKNKDNIQILLETWNGESVRFYHDLPPYIKAVTKTYGSWQPDMTKQDNDNPIKNKTRQIKKADLIVALQKVLADHNIKLPKNNTKLIQQLSIYKEDDKRIPTDRVIALALAVWLAEDHSKVLKPVFQVVEW